MRIISGSFRGRKIVAPNGLPVRPTTDFGKEALFNILNNHYYFNEISVLDLFSGIGSISFEFASRGCPKIVSVERNTGCVDFQNSVIEKLGLEDIMTLHKNDVYRFLELKTPEPFDVIFADPPYDHKKEDYIEILNSIEKNGWLKSEGELIFEHSKKIDFEDVSRLIKTRKYGSVNFSFFDLE